MNYIKQYSKGFVLQDAKDRFDKIASMLDDKDYDDVLKESLTWLNSAIYSPRVIIVNPEDFIFYKGGNFVDVTDLKIDVINNVYYQDTFNESINTILPEVGLLPLICGNKHFTTLGSIADYLILKSNLNMMGRQLESDGDYELFPQDETGKRLLQLRNKALTRIEFLPFIDRDSEEWYLYDEEYSALKNVMYCICNIRNYEQIMSAQTLGVSKEASNLIDYWDKKLEATKKEFQDKVLINYIA